MSITAFTWDSALQVAEAVLQDRTKQCINADFQKDADLTKKATFEQLQKKLEGLAVSKADETKKRRLMVILRMTNPPAITDQKEIKKIAVAGCKAAPACFPTSKELAQQKQKELSILLLGHEFMQKTYIYVEGSMAETEAIRGVHGLDADLDLTNPDMFQFAVAFSGQQFIRLQGSKAPKVTFQFELGTYSDKTIKKLRRFLSHPNPLLRTLAARFIKANQVASKYNGEFIRKVFQEIFFFAHKHLYKDKENQKILKTLYPSCFQVLKYLDDYLHAHANDGNDIFEDEFFIGLVDLKKDAKPNEFSQSYKQCYESLTQIQKDHFAAKEDFWKEFGHRAKEFVLQEADLPSPDKLVEQSSPKTEGVAKKPKKKKKKPSHAAKTSELSPTADAPTKQEEKKPPVNTLPQIKRILQQTNFSYSTITYDETSVKKWLNARKVIPKGFTPDEAVWKHAFSLIVDQFLGTDYCFQDVWKHPIKKSEHPCFCILADITFRSGETIQGVFQYTFDKNGICFHRWFGPMSNIERLDKVIKKRKQEINFPPLRRPEKPSFEEIDKTQFAIDPFFESITFDDKENGLKITIYKVEE